MIKTGDRVRFLNAVGGGVVTRFIKKDLVGVLDDDGFEIPVLTKECVVVAEVNKMNFPVQKPTVQTETKTEPVTIKAPVAPEPEEWDESEETDYGNEINLYLAFVPTQIKSLFNSAIDVFLINDSNYTLGYCYATVNHKSEHSCRDNGTMHPNTKLFLETLEKEELNKIRQVTVQAIAFKKSGTYTPKPTLDFAVKLPISDFNKLHCFSENDFFDEQAMIIPLMEKDLPAAFIKPDPEEIKKAMLQKETPAVPKKAAPEKKRERISPIVEVDLHIHKLLDSTAGMDNAAILSYQMDKFRETLEQHKNKKGQKIVFIHGKGEGVLRKEILKELKLKYPTYYFQDASFREYGFGATMITIR
ncbi:DUF2027 domain-containing protein [Paludibacter jiangxiensis]|uniref:Smr domain-containing protein n=1 Tax=Paludibacter jiangxiensis TaxID=681398 RepID=A0A170Y2Q3_9BACT|nr:DUF2027 domain-containing protein [Paludibacter jiangxiensis]GAT61462.1 Smr domain-containing protein [Paludibacter jiangxiensis]